MGDGAVELQQRCLGVQLQRPPGDKLKKVGWRLRAPMAGSHDINQLNFQQPHKLAFQREARDPPLRVAAKPIIQISVLAPLLVEH